MRARITGIVSVLSHAARRRLGLVLGGSVLVSVAEAGGVLLILPLMLLITGSDPDRGGLGTLRAVLGDPNRTAFGIWLAVIVVVSFLVKALATVAFRWWMLGTLARESVHTSTEVLEHYVRMPYVDHLQRGPANLLRTMGDAVTTFYGAVVTGAIGLLTEAIGILVMVVALTVTAPVPALVLFVYFAGASLVYRRVAAPHMTRIGEEMTDLSVRTFEAAYTVLGGIKAIKLRGDAGHFIEEYRSASDQMVQTQRQATMLGELPKYLLEILFVIGVGVTTATVFATDASGRALGVLALFVAAGFRVLPGTTRLLGALNNITVGLPFADLVVEEVTQARRLAAEAPGTTAVPTPLPFRHRIRLDGLRFSYPESEDDVVRGVDLEIPRGSSIGFVGPSGAGKTTLVDLLLGLHAPRAGRILVDDVDVADELPRWRSTLAMVPQDVYLLDRSLRENVALGVPADRIDEHRLRVAIEQAQLSDVVEAMPQGLDTRLGDRGSRISGGQRQRIGIARALYTAPSLLVLDEATSALDNITERRIADTIEGLHGEITVVVVAHRLSTVRRCDQIVYLSEGRVAAHGTFTEVQRQSPEFARLVALGSLDADETSAAN